jgi:hypothetical protein
VVLVLCIVCVNELDVSNRNTIEKLFDRSPPENIKGQNVGESVSNDQQPSSRSNHNCDGFCLFIMDIGRNMSP